jgi:PAS domain S-box-containing protein
MTHPTEPIKPAEAELLKAKEALWKQAEWLRVTLASIGDAVITTDTDGNILTMNAVAQNLTGWKEEDAKARPLDQVFRIVNEDTGAPIENPAHRALREGRIVGLANHTLLVSRDGTRTPIDDSAAPIRDEQGTVYGVVLIFRSITERRRAEIALQDQARLAAIVESSQDAIISKTLEGIIMSWNFGAEQMFGYTALEAVGRSITILIPPDRIDEESMILESLRRGERIEHYETVRVAKDGRRIYVSLAISPLRDPSGTIIGASKISRDITARRRAEQRLNIQNTVTKALAESSNLTDAAPKILQAVCEAQEWPVGALWCVEEDADVLRCVDVHHLPDANVPQFEALCRSGATFTRGTGLPGRIWAERRSAWIRDVMKDPNFPRAPIARAEGLHSAFGFPIILDNEVLGVMEFLSHDIREPDAELLRMMNAIGSQVGQFIERRNAEGALRTSGKRTEETARFLADASGELSELTDYKSTLQRVAALAVPFFADWCAIDMLDNDGSIQRLAAIHKDPAKTEWARELLRRYPPDPNEPRGLYHVLRTGKTDWMAEIPASLIEQSARDEEHLRILRELGPKSYISTPLCSRTKTIGVMTFVTAESGHVYDAADVAAAEDLARRTVIAIENANLLATLKESDRRKDEFLAMLAHELRNPLAPIRNAVQIFRGKGTPVPELQWATEVIDRQVRQLSRLVDDLLDVSRITRGKVELRKEPVELSVVIQSAVEASRPLIEKWGHDLIVTIPPEPIPLEADPTRLAQVFLNLLNNAAKYTDRGGRIHLSAERQDGDVVVRVIDNGIGIPTDKLPQVFDLFAQLDPSMERSEGGLGIGLTLVQRLVAMHDGTVEAKSQGLGTGSEFIVRLPTRGAAVKQGPQATEQPFPVEKRRILIVDDNRDAADSLAVLLRMMGNEVHTAHDGLEAVGAAAAFKPDMVLLDISLPKLSGYEAARRIREQEGGKDMLLVALTGWSQEEDRRRSREAGFDHHMNKPVDFDILKQLLTETHRKPSSR